MDVRLPDGTIIKNVPDGMSKADLTAKLQANGYDISKLNTQKFTSTTEPIEQGVPEWARKFPAAYGVAGALRETVGPLLEGGGMIGGAMAGAAGGPVGSVAGAGLGYGLGKQATRMADVALGNVQPGTLGQEAVQSAQNVAEGGMMEMGGQMLVPALSAAVKGVAKASGAVADFATQKAKLKAADIVRKTLGDDVAAAQAAFRGAPSNVTAAQALAQGNIVSPATQALLDGAILAEPKSVKFVTELLSKQDAARYAQLVQISKGADQTAARTAQAEMKGLLNDKLIPVLNTELTAANTAGKLGPKFASDAERFAQAASDKVGDVRRFTAVQDRAGQVLSASAQPVPPRYTYLGGDLMKRAEQVASEAAEGSMRFGEASRFSLAALDSLAAHGLKPLKTDAIVGRIQATAAKPEFAGNADIQAVLGRVATDLKAWTDAGGVIDAWALDSIRKNSVNSAVKALYPAAETKVQKELAAKVLGNVKPLIVDAIEQAGGTGYGSYLKSYSEGMQQIGQTKLGAEAMRLYQSSPKKFIELVEGNSPKAVEKIFGPGNYDLAKQMSAEAMTRMKGVAGELQRDARIASEASAGQNALRRILQDNISEFRFPQWINATVALANRSLAELEKKLGKDIMKELTKASQSGKSMDELLSTLPVAQRNKFLQVMQNPGNYIKESVSAKDLAKEVADFAKTRESLGYDPRGTIELANKLRQGGGATREMLATPNALRSMNAYSAAPLVTNWLADN